jgi:hypothetical protein
MIAHIKTDSGLTAVIGGKAYTITNDNPSYNSVWDAIANEEAPEDIVDLFNAANAVKRYAQGDIEVTEHNELLFHGEPIHNVVVDRIFDFMSKGLPHKPLIAFLNNLLANPSRRSTEELYKFLEHKNLPITEDGCFLAYKGVRDDYKDVHSGKFDNFPGNKHEMPRNQVDDDFRNHCSRGFHVGSLEYATHWGSRTVIVKVNPADVVSVPSDSDCQKCRVWKYEVLCNYTGPLPAPLHSDDPYNDSFYEEGEDHTYDY